METVLIQINTVLIQINSAESVYLSAMEFNSYIHITKKEARKLARHTPVVGEWDGNILYLRRA